MHYNSKLAEQLFIPNPKYRDKEVTILQAEDVGERGDMIVELIFNVDVPI